MLSAQLPSPRLLPPLLVLLGAGSCGLSAEEEEGDPLYKQLSPIMDILPAGSVIKGVRVPHFDKDKRRAALLRAGIVKIISEGEIEGEEIELRYFQQDQEIMRMRMANADFSLDTGILTAREYITVSGKGVEGEGLGQGDGRGSGGVFHLETRTGFVRGPVSTRFARPPEKPGKDDESPAEEPGEETAPPPPSPSGLAQEEFLEPEALTPGELRVVKSLISSRSKSVLADRAPTREFLIHGQQLSEAAEERFRSFTKMVNQGNLLARVNPKSPPPPRYELKTGEILVTCAGGMFLDPENGHISYLRDVELFERRFTVTCAGHLKIFFEPRELTQGNPDSVFNDLDDVKLIVASGGVRVVQHDPSGERAPVIATGETAIVDRKTGDIVLQGGTPTIAHGLNSLRAGAPDLYLRMHGNGNIFAEKGLWTTTGDLATLQQLRDGENNDEDQPADEEGAPQGGQKNKEPQTITATCSGGIYFDAKEGHIVYLGDVKITDPRFSVSAKDEIKVFLRRNPEAGEGDRRGPEAFSDVDHVVASGEVTMIREDPKGKKAPITVTAEHAIFNVQTTDVILQGGAPAIKQGDNALRAGEPDLYLRFYQNGSLFAEPGAWTTSGDLANLRRKEGEAKKPIQRITASCQGGLYFDSLQGHIVYLDEIVVVEPRFRMSCNGNLRIHLKLRDDASEERLEGPEAFSDVDKIVALGGVTVTRADPRGKDAPITAKAETATYDAESENLVLRGGLPMIRQGKSFLKAREQGLYLLFKANGSFEAKEGSWEQYIEDQDFEKLREQKDKLGN